MSTQDDRRSKYAIPQGKPTREYTDLMGRRWADPQDATPLDTAALYNARLTLTIPDNGGPFEIKGYASDGAKPRLRLRVKLGQSSRMPLWTVTDWDKEPTPLTTWRAHCAQAIGDATRRNRLGLGL